MKSDYFTECDSVYIKTEENDIFSIINKANKAKKSKLLFYKLIKWFII